MPLLNRTFAQIAILAITTASSLAAADKPEPAPRFTAKSLDGETFNNDSVKGKVVLLQFWATWCKYCRGEQPIVDTLNSEFKDKGLLILAIDVGESKKKVKKYLDESPRECRVVLTEDTNLAAMFAASVYPIYVVIDRDGNVAGTQRGAAGERSLRRLLGKAGLEPE
ncbi:MAG TPA: TlpA disulfide reductase family protein [Bryobacteraceae bacterium]|nr:TlpA disulfide reductase family protein [Bryobacteraceae bacterium]